MLKPVETIVTILRTAPPNQCKWRTMEVLPSLSPEAYCYHLRSLKCRNERVVSAAAALALEEELERKPTKIKRQLSGARKRPHKLVADDVSSPRILKVHARRIFGSSGAPTLEVDLYIGNALFRAAVPSGETGPNETLELGVLKAGQNVNEVISPAIRKAKLDVTYQRAVDDFLLKLNRTAKLEANAIFGISLAICKAGAAENGVPLYQHISEIAKINKMPYALPVPAFTVINGILHVGNNLAIQELMILPTGAKSFAEAMKMGSECYHVLKNVIEVKYGQDAMNTGGNGVFAPNIQDNREGLELLKSAIDKAGYTGKVKIGMDVAGSDMDFRNPNSEESKWLSADQLTGLCKSFVDEFGVVSITHPFDLESLEAFTNPAGIRTAIEKKACNALLLKVNQIRTVSEFIESPKWPRWWL